MRCAHTRTLSVCKAHIEWLLCVSKKVCASHTLLVHTSKWSVQLEYDVRRRLSVVTKMLLLVCNIQDVEKVRERDLVFWVYQLPVQGGELYAVVANVSPQSQLGVSWSPLSGWTWAVVQVMRDRERPPPIFMGEIAIRGPSSLPELSR